MKRYILIVLLIYLLNAVKAQLNPVYLTIPTLLLDVNIKTGGMGETGVASTGSTFFTGPHQNPSLLAKAERNAGFYFSCIPQINEIMENEFAVNILSFYKLNEKNVLSIDFTYINIGKMYVHDYLSRIIDVCWPYDYDIGLTYAHRFTNNLSAGTTLKFIDENLTNGCDYYEDYRPARTLALDLGMDYEKKVSISDKLSLNYDLGAALENMGPRVSYTRGGDDKYFIPANFAIGLMTSFIMDINDKTSLITSLSYQAEKLLVPTPPEYYPDSISPQGNLVIKSGKEPPSFVPFSWIQSFYDAPGGIEEEWHEILHKAGAEICLKYKENFRLALRYGRFCEHWSKGNRKYNTLGAGVYIHGITIDAKWIPGDKRINSFKNSYGLAAGLQLNL
jgi:hypothetical protein